MEYVVFSHSTVDETLIEEFEKVMKDFELSSLFTEEHKSTSIKVDYLDLKSVINKSGASVSHLQDFSKFIQTSDDNKMYASVMLRTLNTPRTFKQMMNIIKKTNDYISHKIADEHMFNMWNIVWYNEDLY